MQIHLSHDPPLHRQSFAVFAHVAGVSFNVDQLEELSGAVTSPAILYIPWSALFRITNFSYLTLTAVRSRQMLGPVVVYRVVIGPDLYLLLLLGVHMCLDQGAPLSSEFSKNDNLLIAQ